MSRRMSVSMTLDAVRARTKTVTRRHIDTWQNLHSGDRLTLIEKGMGLPKGARQVVVCEVEVTDVRVEPLHLMVDDVRYGRQEVDREGLGHMTPSEFVDFWLGSHGYGGLLSMDRVGRALANGGPVVCRRIEWRYLDDETPELGVDLDGWPDGVETCICALDACDEFDPDDYPEGCRYCAALDPEMPCPKEPA